MDLPSLRGYNRVPLEDSAAVVRPTLQDFDEVEVGSVGLNLQHPLSPTAQALAEANAREILELEASLAAAHEEEAMLTRQLDEVNAFWQTKVAALQREVEQVANKRQKHEDLLAKLQLQYNEDILDHHPDEPDGPEWLEWVRGARFTFVCNVVVVINLVTMFMEMLHPHYQQDFFILDQLVLVWYIMELTLKGVLYRGNLLLGPCKVVWWNWLDTVIVFVGILDQWAEPLVLPHQDGSSGDNTAVQIIKMLRLARLARILKTVRAFMESDLSWTEGKHFQLFIMGTIAFNSVVMSLESDLPQFAIWFYVEQVLLTIFSFELLVRLRFKGCKFFCDPDDLVWNWMDFIIVAGGIVDQWLMPCITIFQTLLGMENNESMHIGDFMTLLRMARLLRILRLVKLVRNIPPLFTLIVGILKAMQGMAWVLVLTFIVLYAFGLLCVRLFGRTGLAYGGDAPASVDGIFPGVLQSMFVLFKVMNGDMDPIKPLLDELPITKLVFVLYMVISSWAILSILTAVVSENMIAATDVHRLEQERECTEMRQKHARLWLQEVFNNADSNQSGKLDEQEFMSILNDRALASEISEQTCLKKEDIEQIFGLLRTTDKVSSDDFIEALQIESRAVTERSIMRLEKRILDLQQMLLPDLEGGRQHQKSQVHTLDLAAEEQKMDERFSRLAEAMQFQLDRLQEQLERGREDSEVQCMLSKLDKKLDDLGTTTTESMMLRLEELLQAQQESTVQSVLSKWEVKLASNGTDTNRVEESVALRCAADRMEQQGFALRSLLNKLSESMDESKDATVSLESSVRKIESTIREQSNIQVWAAKIDSFCSQQQSALDVLATSIEQKLDQKLDDGGRAKAELKGLISKYERRMDLDVSAIQNLSAKLEQLASECRQPWRCFPNSPGGASIGSAHEATPEKAGHDMPPMPDYKARGSSALLRRASMG
eukprot:TRINITY_DN41514_c0_g1_i1.p1 TRINITY_DN41514_c0_g1~~TRINITY_DN41514_c0_g1_i1.p1  ORF type:complete len:941 (+),score=218.77 TRINITY_DN41514_c0_g1_i1:85-2907(+)